MSLSADYKEKIEKYLEELSKDYEELLYKALLEKSKSMNDISISELLRLDSEIKRPLLEKDRAQNKFRKLLSFIGLLYFYIAVIMILIYFIINSDIFMDFGGVFLLISIIIGIIGLIIISFSFLSPLPKKVLLKDKYFSKDIKIFTFEVISRWKTLEGVVNDLTTKKYILMRRSIIDFLVVNRFINNSEKDILMKLLKVRNSIVHDYELEYNYREIIIILRQTDKIIEKLQKIL